MGLRTLSVTLSSIGITVQARTRKRKAHPIAVLVLLMMFGLAVHSMVQKSPTFDEQGFIVRGLAYLRGTNREIRVGHPLGLNALSASLLYFDETINLPPSDLGTDFHTSAESFLWQLGNNVEKVMLLARIPTVFLGMLLVAVSGRWVKELTKSAVLGLLGMTVIAFDPNVMAHTRLATTDLGLVFGVIAASYTLWRWLNKPTVSNTLLFSLGFAILQNSKFTAGLFVPIFGVIILLGLFRFWRTGTFAKPLAQIVFIFPLVSLFLLWAMYGFAINTLPNSLPSLSFLSGLTIPLAPHIEQLADIGGRMQLSTPAFLLGDYSDSGWWYYFPVAFALKTPIVTMAVMLCGTVLWIARGKWVDWLVPLVSALGFFAFSMTTDINIGYRHILLVTVLLVICGVAGLRFLKVGWLGSLLVGLVVVAVNLWIAPHYLTYFNLFAGGAENGWRLLSDSNIDWGQDLGALKVWMDENGVEEVRLSYFGEARPDYYGINYVGLPSVPPRLMHPDRVVHYPADPGPGTYAISASNLQGVLFQNHGLFAFFRDLEPRAKVGNSIFIYDVEPRYDIENPIQEILLAGGQVDAITPELYATFGTNDIELSWYDPKEALMLGSSTNSRWVSIKGSENNDYFQDITQVVNINEIMDYRRLDETHSAIQYLFLGFLESWDNGNPIVFTHEGHEIQLSGVDIEYRDSSENFQAEIRSFWYADSPPPFKIFIHITKVGETTPIGQWDGLGVATEGWRDQTIGQVSTILIEDIPKGDYEIWVGAYSPNTSERWQTNEGDRALIGEFSR